MKQIEDLPIQDAILTALTQLVPGYNGTWRWWWTWNGLPSIAQGNNIDGVIGQFEPHEVRGKCPARGRARIEAY